MRTFGDDVAVKQGFWQSTAGIVTGITGALTAIAGLITALVTTGVLHGSPSAASNPQPPIGSGATAATATATPSARDAADTADSASGTASRATVPTADVPQVSSSATAPSATTSSGPLSPTANVYPASLQSSFFDECSRMPSRPTRPMCECVLTMAQREWNADEFLRRVNLDTTDPDLQSVFEFCFS